MAVDWAVVLTGATTKAGANSTSSPSPAVAQAGLEDERNASIPTK
jgi:hypothetical protein